MTDKDNVVSLTGGDVDAEPVQFLDIVKAGISSRPVLDVLCLVLDRQGRLTLHSSSGDLERVMAMLSAGSHHTLQQWGETVLQTHGEPDDAS